VTAALKRVEPHGIITSDDEHIAADVLIYATGFEVGSVGALQVRSPTAGVLTRTDLLTKLDWYLGIVSPALPNFFAMAGPSTALGHNSLLVMIEAQVAYAVRCVQLMQTSGVCRVCVKEDLARQFSNDMDQAHKTTVWGAGGCQAWYRDERGRISTLWPYSTVRYVRDTKPISTTTTLSDVFVCHPLVQPVHVPLSQPSSSKL